MRYWLAGVVAKKNPTLFRDLPESFKVGQPLPAHSLTRPALPGHPLPSNGRGKSGRARSPLRADGKSNFDRHARSDAPYPRFVHGGELLAV
jgi:hypothetical protein